MEEQIKNMSLDNKQYYPGTILKEKYNDKEYILIGYDLNLKNIICVESSNVDYKNEYIINVDNIDYIIRENKIYTKLPYYF
jgi:hypothetical protein